MTSCDIQGDRYKTGLCYGCEGARVQDKAAGTLQPWERIQLFMLRMWRHRFLNRRVIWSEMQLKTIISDWKGRKDWSWTGTHVEVAAAHCSRARTSRRCFCAGSGQYTEKRIMHLTSSSGKAQGGQRLQSERLEFHSWLREYLKLWASYFTLYILLSLFRNEETSTILRKLYKCRPQGLAFNRCSTNDSY